MNTTITAPGTERVSLYYREGSSDKVYEVAIEPRGDLFVVNFAFGRRGSTLSTGAKTPSPVNFQLAKRIFDKLIQEKMAKGYSPGPNGTPYQHTESAGRVTAILPQLLNPIDYREVKRLLKDPAWSVQEKLDGKRTLLRKKTDEVIGINRKGLVIGLPSRIIASARLISGDFVLDGESIAECLHVFDLLECNGVDFRSKPYHQRLVALSGLLNHSEVRHIKFVETATAPAQKEILFKRLQSQKKEGVVLKRLDAPYSPGRPGSSGVALKHKFYGTLSAVVSKLNPQRSVELRLLNCEGWVQVGNVTIPPNHPVPGVGAVVEVRYLYAFRQSRSLYQPTYLSVRNDIEQHECVTSQLKFKAEEEEA